MSIEFSKPIIAFEDSSGVYYESKNLPEGWCFRLEREYMGDRHDEWIVKTDFSGAVEKWNVKHLTYYKLAC